MGLALAFCFALASVARAGAATDPASLVDPFVGTSGTKTGGPIDTFPGADAPFGMVQWSPDTPSQPAGGGYAYADTSITGFSLTHLSGPGCSVFGDAGILPTVGEVANPASAKQPFTHATEVAQPGYYAVTVGNPGIRTQLTVTQRTGLGAFTFPATPQANLLFNASSDQAGVTDAGVWIVGDDEIVGSATSGSFCGMPDVFTVYFAARFNRPFVAHGTWRNARVTPDARAVRGAGSGGWVTFDTRQNPTVEVQTAVSWVSVAGAEANLRADATTWNLRRVREARFAQWSRLLGRVRIAGGTPAERRVFYTALYHAMLHPNLYSDAGGRYRGFDGRVHRAARGHREYANFSGWDVYRTQIPLIALLAPRRTGDMMRSLVDAAEQGGWLPKWALANGYTGVMGGDSADPILAGAYAFGARDFDARAALAAMVKGATRTSGAPGQGWYVERPGLGEYLSRGYVVNTHTTNVSPVPNGASMTLEYALDDFSIAMLARSLHDRPIAREMLARAQNWSELFDTSTGLIEPRGRSGAFMETPITDNGQSGFQEGNAAQYTWMVPQNLRALVEGMGGDARAIEALDAFFTHLNAGPNQPYAWLGNEPSLGSPWAYLSAGAPWKAQRVVRSALDRLYADAPDGIPGNDDLGTMSAWFVWCALGLYPQNPAVPVLDVGAPLFTRVSIRVPGGAHIRIVAPQASDANAYVRSLRVDGRPWAKSWVALDTHRALHLDFVLGAAPDERWASASNDAPPSYALAPVRFPPSTLAGFSLAPVAVALKPGTDASVSFGLDNAHDPIGVAVTWGTAVSHGLSVSPRSGTFAVAGGSAQLRAVNLAAAANLASGLYDVRFAGEADNGAILQPVTAMVSVARAGERLRLAYVANYGDGTLTPIDPRTHAYGVPIAVGQNPGGLAFAPDGRRLYVADQGSNDVSVVDTQLQRTVATVPVGKTPAGIGVTPDGATIWVSNYGDGTVQPIDAVTLKAGPAIAVGSQPENLAISPDGSTLYVADQGSDAVTVVDVHARAVRATIAVGARPMDVVVAPDGRTVYVSDQRSNAVTPIDVATLRAGAAIPAGVVPQGLAIGPRGKTLWVADSGSDTIVPIDLATRKPQAPVVVGLNPTQLRFLPGSETALVVNLGDGDCQPVDTRTRRAFRPIPVGEVPVAVAVEPRNTELERDVRQQRVRARKNSVEHRYRKLAGVGVLPAWVERGDERDAPLSRARNEL